MIERIILDFSTQKRTHKVIEQAPELDLLPDVPLNHDMGPRLTLMDLCTAAGLL